MVKTAKSQVISRQVRPRELLPLPSRGEVLFSKQDIAASLRVTIRTLDKMIASGEYPQCDFRLRNTDTGDPRWRMATHDSWVLRQVGIGSATEET